MRKKCFLLLFSIVCNGLFGQNLIVNGDCEQALINGEIPGWQETIGTGWTQRQAGPEPKSGLHYFFAGASARGELRQVVDISAFACRIDAGTQNFQFSAYTRSFDQSPRDQSLIQLSFLNANDSLLQLNSFGPFTDIDAWRLTDTNLIAPAGARNLLIALISIRAGGSNNDGYFDHLSLVPLQNTPCPAPSSAFTALGSDSCMLPFSVDFTDLSTEAPISWKWHFEGAETDSSSEANPAGIVYLSPGTYDVTLITCNLSGCDTLFLQDYIIVNNPPEPPGVIIAGDTLKASGNGTFQWYESGNLSEILSTNAYYVPLSAGVYVVVLTDAFGCTALSLDIPVSGLSLQDVSSVPSIKLFPNPTQSSLFVEMNHSTSIVGNVRLRNITGQLLVQKTIETGRQLEIHTNDLAPGSYLLEFYTGEFLVAKRFFISQ
jgi:PKD repeat protein